VTTNRGLPDWGQIFGDPVAAAAILDRLMHNAVVFNIKGPSWRLREHQALATATTATGKETTTYAAHPRNPRSPMSLFSDHRCQVPVIAHTSRRITDHKIALTSGNAEPGAGFEPATFALQDLTG
jgi:hypothetical protein